MALDPIDINWEIMRQEYESPGRSITDRELCEKFAVKLSTFQGYKSRHGWMNMRKVQKEVEKRVSMTLAERTEELVEKMMKKRLDVCETAMETVEMGMEKFKSKVRRGEHKIKDFQEAKAAFELGKNAAGLGQEEDAGVRIGVNVGLLSPTPVDAPTVEV